MGDSDDTLSNNSGSLNVMFSYNGDSEYSSTNLDDESHLPYDVTEKEQNLVNSLSDILKMLDYNKKHLDSFTQHFENLTRAIKAILTKVSIILENEVDTVDGNDIIRNETSLDQNESQPRRIPIIKNQLMTKGLSTATGMKKKKNRTKSKSVEVEDSEMEELYIDENSLNKGRLSKPRLCKSKAVTDESLLKSAIMTGKLNKSAKLENLEVEPSTSGCKLNEETLSKTRLSKKKVMGVTKSLKNAVPTGMKNKKNRKGIKSGEDENSEMEPGTSGRILNRLLNPRLCKSKAMSDENLLKHAILTGKLTNKSLKLNGEKLSKTGLCEKKGKKNANEGKRAAYKRKAASLDGMFNKRVKKTEEMTRSFVAPSTDPETNKKKLYSSEAWLHSLSTSFK